MERLLAGHRQFLAFLEKRVESREAAEDILQSAFVKGMEHGDSLRGEEKVVAWFYRMLRNAVVDHYRKRESASKAMDAWQRELPEAANPEVRKRVCECLNDLMETLKPEYREALRIVDVEESSLADLGKSAGITPANAAVRIHRARQALRKQVQAACGVCAKHGCVDCTCA